MVERNQIHPDGFERHITCETSQPEQPAVPNSHQLSALPLHSQVDGEDCAVDDLLDDIDSILESNATAFVQGFVQKGGE